MFARVLQPILSPTAQLGTAGASAVSLLARLVFASVLLPFFVTSFLTKVSGLSLTVGAYYQILPRQLEAVSYDPSQISLPMHLVVIAGTLAEGLLPVLVVLGLATRPAALAMIGFLAVMSLTDIYGHGVDAKTIGMMFDGDPSGLILDQRLLWGFVLAILVPLGGGAVSLDALIWPRLRRWRVLQAAQTA